jgi:inhibitor of KinA
MTVLPISEKAVTVTFGHAIDPAVHARVLGLSDWLHANPFPGMVAVMPAYTTATVYFDPQEVRKQWGVISPARAVAGMLEQVLPDIPPREQAPGVVTEIPVRYGGEYGPDLSLVARRLRLAEADVIRLHTEAVYTVYMIGFLPGFPYMGPLAPALELPRRESPRMRVPAGSVAIAGPQTGVYPQASPGGWHLIGMTEMTLFDPNVHPPCPLESGGQVRFVAL